MSPLAGSAVRGGRTTRPGSIAHQIAECARDASETAGHGLTVGDHEIAYAARHGVPPATYAAQFFSLVRRGILVAIDGRTSRTRYAHHENAFAHAAVVRDAAAEVATDDEDDALKVLAALRHATPQSGGGASTDDVARALKELGLQLQSTDINAVRVRLRTLARPRRRGLEIWAAPRVTSVEIRTVSGRRLVLWAPAQTEASATLNAGASRPLTAADAVRELVLTVQATLGRPVFRRELQWWLEANRATAPAVHLNMFIGTGKQTISELLAATAGADARRAGGAGRLQRVSREFSCWGGAAPRYWVGDMDAAVERVVAIEELANGLRLADELSAIEVLVRRSKVVRVRAVDRLIDVRRGALAQYLSERLEGGAEAVQGAMGVLLQSYALCRIWAATGARTEDGRYTRLLDLDERERHVRALPACAAVTPGQQTGRTAPRFVGPESAVTLDVLEPFLAAAELELDIPQKVARVACLKGVRRVPLRDAGGSRFGSHPARADVGYDRVDALLKVYRMAPAMRTHALLDIAAELLGPVLRDPALLRPVATATSATPGLRRAAMIALALLGEGPAADVAERYCRGDAQDGRAVLLATTISAAERPLLLDEPALQRAQYRLAGGRLLTALG